MLGFGPTSNGPSGRLWPTLVAEAAIPLLVVDLWRKCGDHLGRLGAVSAWAYAYACVSFTVVHALIGGTPDYASLSDSLRLSMTLSRAFGAPGVPPFVR
jgi:hypothetical protein